MAVQTDNPSTTPSAEVVGNAFIYQYYQILYHSPELVLRFYHDSSVLSRPDSNGVMTLVTTKQGINEKILSMDYKNYKAEIKTADTQMSYNGGMTVSVSGCLTGKDNLRRKFTQLFFLAPQDKGYFVLNDVFRYVDDGEPLENQPINDTDDAPIVHSITDPEPTHVPDPPAPDSATTNAEQRHQNMAEKAYDPSDHEIQPVIEIEAVEESQPLLNGNDDLEVVELVSSSAQEDLLKKSYASIVTKGSPGPTKIDVPTNTAKMTPKKTESQSVGSVAPSPAPEESAPSSIDIPESSNTHEEAADVFLWRNKKCSAGVLGGATAIWVLFELVEYHLLTLVCHILILSLAVLFPWSNAHTFINKSPPRIPEVLLPEEPFLQVAAALRIEINQAFAVLQEITSGRDLKKFLIVIAALWVLSIVGSWCNFLTLFYISFVSLHTVPVIYEKYEDKIDPFAEKAMLEIKKQYAVFDAKVLSKIPKGPLKAKRV